MDKKNQHSKNRPNRWIIGMFLGEEKDYFIENIAMLLGSGISITAALGSVKVEVKSQSMKQLISFLEEDIENGLPLWKALENTGIMNESTISLIRIGESSGRLSENLKIIGTQQQKERLFQSKIRSAMMYPGLVLSLTAIVGIGIAWFILPKLATVFSQMHIKLPWITKMLIQFGIFLGKYGIIFVPSTIIVLSLAVYVVFFAKKTKFIGQTILFQFAGIRNLIQQIELARFGYVLGTLLDAGLPLIDALQALENSSSIAAYQKFYRRLREQMEEGNTFRISFQSFPRSHRYIPVPVQEMIGSAERSGRLSVTLLAIGNTFEEKVDTTTKNIATLIEPILLVIVWLGVVSVALAVILPIYQLVGDLDTNPSNQSSNSTNNNPPPVTNSETTPNNNSQSPSELPVLNQSAVENNVENSIQPATETSSNAQITIIPVAMGYVNVRERPTTSSRVMVQVHPGESYPMINQQDQWIEIQLDNQTTGWISEVYARINPSQ